MRNSAAIPRGTIFRNPERRQRPMNESNNNESNNRGKPPKPILTAPLSGPPTPPERVPDPE